MEQYKNDQIIILPTENNTNIVKILKDNLHYTTSKNIPGGIYQNLYILSDDEIKEGEWCYNMVSKTIFQANKEFIKLISDPNVVLTTDKKIIATTDTSLFKLKDCPIRGSDSSIKYILPQPSQQFIEKYIESYNKGSQIIDVLVEYESIEIKVGQYAYLDDVQLKINSDNTINIQSAKESWTRDEIDFKLNKLLNELLISKRNLFLINNPDSNKICSFLNKWTKENL